MYLPKYILLSLFFLLYATGVRAATQPETTPYAPTCAQQITTQRDMAILRATDRYIARWRTLFQTRSVALRSAWRIPDRDDRRRVMREADRDFTREIRQSREDYRDTMRTIEEQYEAARDACGISRRDDVTPRTQSSQIDL